MFTKLLIAVAVVAASTCATVAQDAGQAMATQPPSSRTIRNLAGFAQQGQGNSSAFMELSEDQKQARELRNRIREATQALRSAESSSDREKAQEQLREVLLEDYDARMDAYENYLTELENRLSEMKKKLDRRRQAKSDMVNLRIQVLEAEADDLGWPEDSSSFFQRTPSWRGMDSPFGATSRPILGTRTQNIRETTGGR